MIFSSKEYLVFFVALLILFSVLRPARIKKALLLVASYFFYAFWDYRFMLLMGSMSVVNYVIGKKIEGTEVESSRKRWVISSVIFNLIVLGFFKYFNFFLDTANHMLTVTGVSFPLLAIILPVGISFITFEVMSYTIDIYRRVNGSAKSFWDLALLVSFFPHLIAGPILKPREFLPQLEREIVIRWANVERGSQIFLLGLSKKLLVADRLAMFVDPVFNAPQTYSSVTVCLAVISYAAQIYCDFSGYSDMAIGSALCMGFQIPQNFNMPYASRSITEFWRRWHISLSTWLKEYLYISLGGNRSGKLRQYLNLFLTMLLGGLWHGSSWNFVFWGGLHGVGLIVHKLFTELTESRLKPSRVLDGFGWLATFVFVCFCWVFFRSKDFGTSLIILQKIFFIVPVGTNWFATSFFWCAATLVICHAVGLRLRDYFHLPLKTTRGMFALFMVLFGLLYLAPVTSSPFIYFQF